MTGTRTSEGCHRWQRSFEHHDGVIDHLDKTATKLVDSDTMLVYRITRP